MEDDDEYELPLRDQRYFGAGIKRKRINFVPSISASTTTAINPSTESAADRYLAIVFNKTKASEALKKQSVTETAVQGLEDVLPDTVCPLCHRTVRSGDNKAVHESSIAHQICLEHSHPPSSIDRGRKGLAVLQTQGWDPDARKGLGVQGEGRLHPIKAKENPNRAGLGADLTKPFPKPKPTRLDAGQVKAMEAKSKTKAQDLRNAFYRSEDVERYLGQDQGSTTLDPKAFKRSKNK